MSWWSMVNEDKLNHLSWDLFLFECHLLKLTDAVAEKKGEKKEKTSFGQVTLINN